MRQTNATHEFHKSSEYQVTKHIQEKQWRVNIHFGQTKETHLMPMEQDLKYGLNLFVHLIEQFV